MFSPDPEPHTAIGSCPADYVIPIQRAKSQIMRDTLDSLGHSIFPRMGVVEGQVNIDDVLNTDIGQPIRMRAPGMVQPFSVPFVGKEAFPVLGYLDEAKENRTGVSKASAGLNAEALQSTTKAAVSATMSGAQGRVELICRHFAEGGMKELFSLVNNLVIKHQEGQDMFRLNNQFVPIDPRYWDSDKDVSVVTDVQAVKRAIRNLVLLNIYEKPFHPEISSGVRDMLFELMTPVTAALLARHIEDVIENYEPRARLTGVRAIPDYDRNSYSVTIEFYVVNTPTELVDLTIFLERLR